MENDLENIFFTIPLFLIHIFPVFNQTDDNHQGLVAQEDDINDNADDDDDDDNDQDDDDDGDDQDWRLMGRRIPLAASLHEPLTNAGGR